jgi:hypothetical protein
LLTEATGTAVTLQSHAEVIGPHLHPELPGKVLANLLGRNVIAKSINGAQCGMSQA